MWNLTQSSCESYLLLLTSERFTRAGSLGALAFASRGPSCVRRVGWPGRSLPSMSSPLGVARRRRLFHPSRGRHPATCASSGGPSPRPAAHPPPTPRNRDSSPRMHVYKPSWDGKRVKSTQLCLAERSVCQLVGCPRHSDSSDAGAGHATRSKGTPGGRSPISRGLVAQRGSGGPRAGRRASVHGPGWRPSHLPRPGARRSAGGAAGRGVPWGCRRSAGSGRNPT